MKVKVNDSVLIWTTRVSRLIPIIIMIVSFLGFKSRVERSVETACTYVNSFGVSMDWEVFSVWHPFCHG